ncbi:MAG: hypothetical protein HZC44_03740 [Geobacter sp.]|nr:hypothetical protein [Geobacter sp.]
MLMRVPAGNVTDVGNNEATTRRGSAAVGIWVLLTVGRMTGLLLLANGMESVGLSTLEARYVAFTATVPATPDVNVAVAWPLASMETSAAFKPLTVPFPDTTENLMVPEVTVGETVPVNVTELLTSAAGLEDARLTVRAAKFTVFKGLLVVP